MNRRLIKKTIASRPWKRIQGVCLLAAGLLLQLSFPGVASGQVERLELGRRLQRFEQAWETAEPAQRAAAVPAMTTAVRSFFSLNLPAAGKQLDLAWRAVRNESSVGALEKAVVHLQLEVSPHCADVAKSALMIKLTPFYTSEATITDKARLHLRYVDATHGEITATSFPLADCMHGCEWELHALIEGDFQLHAEIREGNDVYKFPTATVSRIDGFDQRISELEATLDGSLGKLDDTVRATVRDLSVLLRSMDEGTIQEIDYPALERLVMCETLLQTEPDAIGETLAKLAQQQDLWLTLAQGRKGVPVRVRAPRETPSDTGRDMGEPLPVLFLFHGAGGSENMFFETYGAGRVVEEAIRRGWLVIAPRQSLFGLSLDVAEMLDVLDTKFTIDRSQVMLLGHSMGAAQVVRQASLHPTIPVAAVALGGGNRIGNASQLAAIRWFVGAGEQDFGRGGAMQLHKSLEAAKVKSVYHDYADVEHMVIVQAAIDDVFQFLDAEGS